MVLVETAERIGFICTVGPTAVRNTGMVPRKSSLKHRLPELPI